MAHSISSDILMSYTVPLSYLLSLYIIYVAVHVLLMISEGVYFLFLLLHYVPALVYVVHRIAVNFNLKTILVTSLSFVLFPLHFILTLNYKIMFSLKILKINPSQSDETTSLLNKIQPDNPLHTFIITFTCVQIPLEVFLQIALYLNHFRNDTGTTILVTCNLALCLLLFTYGAVSYFRFETQNINQYLLSRVNLKRIHETVHAARTYSKSEPADPSRKISQFQVDTSRKLKITDSHSLFFKLIVSVKWLLHNYIRLVSMGLVLYYYPTFTMLFFTSQTILFLLLLLFYHFKSKRRLNLGHDILLSFVLNFCLIEYKIKLSNRKLIFLAYFLIIFVENLLFNYLWYFTANWTRRYRNLFNATIWSLVICQIVHFVLLFIYLVFYKLEQYEIDYYAGEEDEGNETNVSESEDIRDVEDDDNVNGFQTSGRQNYENVEPHTIERGKKPTTRVNVDRIRTPTDDASQKGTQVAGQKNAFDNMIYASNEKMKSLTNSTSKNPPSTSQLSAPSITSKYKELINDAEEQTVYSRTTTNDGRLNKSFSNEDKRKSLTANYGGVNPEQRDSWKYIVEEIDDQIHKSTSNLHKSKLHLSSDRLTRKNNRSTDSLDRVDTPRGSSSASGQLYQPNQSQQQTQYQQTPHQKNLFETSHTKSYSHVKQATNSADVSFPIFTDQHTEEDIVLENKTVDSNLENRRTSRYSSQEFVETRRMDQTSYEEKRTNSKKLNTTSLV